jgi:DNA polymerase III delta prime subunit
LIAFLWWLDNSTYETLLALLGGMMGLADLFLSNKEQVATETLDQRNRRIMLDHVENFWVKGFLEKSLYGAALLQLGVKEEPSAIKTYPWRIKRESTGDTLPSDMSMLDMFKRFGNARSLLILGAPGSGKTTMLLELARQFIELARHDENEPIPIVFNLASWTEKLTFSDWLAQELNIIYTIPKKFAPIWVKENKVLLLLDGLDEVRQESRGKCVDAMNQFRQESGLTNIVVSSRSQDYLQLKERLAFDGAIEVQPLNSEQVEQYFSRFDEGVAGIRQILEKDVVLRQMAKTPLFLSIMTLAYHDLQHKDIEISEDLDLQRKYLFNKYIERMFERPDRIIIEKFKKKRVVLWLAWIAKKMMEHNAVPFLIEDMQPKWLNEKKRLYEILLSAGNILFGAGILGFVVGIFFMISDGSFTTGFILGLGGGLGVGIFLWIISALMAAMPEYEESPGQSRTNKRFDIIRRLSPKSGSNNDRPFSIWDLIPRKEEISLSLLYTLALGLTSGLLFGLIIWLYFWRLLEQYVPVIGDVLGLIDGAIIALWFVFSGWDTALNLWRSSINKMPEGDSLFLHIVNSLIAKLYDDMRKLGETITALGDTITRFGKTLSSWDWIKGRRGLSTGLRIGTLIGLLLGFCILVTYGWIAALQTVLVVALIGSLIGGLASQKKVDRNRVRVERENNIKLVESIKLRWYSAESDYLLMGIVFAVIFTLFFGFFLGPVIGMSIALISGLRLENRPIDKTTYPGQKIVSSIKNFFLIFLGVGFFAGLVVTIIYRTIYESSSTYIFQFYYVLASVILVGLILGLAFGGSQALEFYYLRIILSINNFVPWHFISFLNYCVDLIFLRRVGGSYIFVHRLLMEHFAQLDDETISKLAREAETKQIVVG